MFFSGGFSHLNNRSPLTSIVLDWPEHCLHLKLQKCCVDPLLQGQSAEEIMSEFPFLPQLSLMGMSLVCMLLKLSIN